MNTADAMHLAFSSPILTMRSYPQPYSLGVPCTRIDLPLFITLSSCLHFDSPLRKASTAQINQVNATPRTANSVRNSCGNIILAKSSGEDNPFLSQRGGDDLSSAPAPVILTPVSEILDFQLAR